MRLSWLVHPRNLVVYALVVGAWILTARLGLNRWIVGSVLLGLLLAHYFVLPALALRKLGAFDEKLRRLLVAGKPDELLPFYRSHPFLRAFTPPGVMKHRLAQIHLARRAWPASFQAYHEAMRPPRPGEDFAIRTGYAESGFHVGEDGAIAPVLTRLVQDDRTQPVIHFLLVHVLVSDPDRSKHAGKELERLERRTGDPEEPLVLLARAEVLAAAGKTKRAEQVLENLDEQALPDTLRALATLLAGKLLHVRGKKGSARKLFEKVRGDGRCGRAQLELQEFLEQ